MTYNEGIDKTRPNTFLRQCEMNLYERDYTIILTDEEKEAYNNEMLYSRIPIVKNNRRLFFTNTV